MLYFSPSRFTSLSRQRLQYECKQVNTRGSTNSSTHTGHSKLSNRFTRFCTRPVAIDIVLQRPRKLSLKYKERFAFLRSKVKNRVCQTKNKMALPITILVKNFPFRKSQINKYEWKTNNSRCLQMQTESDTQKNQIPWELISLKMKTCQFVQDSTVCRAQNIRGNNLREHTEVSRQTISDICSKHPESGRSRK